MCVQPSQTDVCYQLFVRLPIIPQVHALKIISHMWSIFKLYAQEHQGKPNNLRSSVYSWASLEDHEDVQAFPNVMHFLTLLITISDRTKELSKILQSNMSLRSHVIQVLISELLGTWWCSVCSEIFNCHLFEYRLGRVQEAFVVDSLSLCHSFPRFSDAVPSLPQHMWPVDWSALWKVWHRAGGHNIRDWAYKPIASAALVSSRDPPTQNLVQRTEWCHVHSALYFSPHCARLIFVVLLLAASAPGLAW